MIRTKNWFEQERKFFDDGLVGSNSPIISHIHAWAIRFESTDTFSFHVTGRVHRKTVWIARLNRAEVNAQHVRQPTARAQTDKFADSMLAAWLDLFHFEVNTPPPLRQRQGIFEYIRDFFSVTLDAPAIDEVVIVRGHRIL